MAGRKININEKIKKAEEVVIRTKDKYDAALAELEQLHRKRDELQNEELLEAFVKSGKSYDEIMEFLGEE